MSDIVHRSTCRMCLGSDLELFLDLGVLPLAGGFLMQSQIKEEVLYPLRVFFCHTCGEVQLLDTVKASVLFKDYRFLSSVTSTLSDHFRTYAREVTSSLKQGAFIVEFGSNDGVLLKPLMELGFRVLGVEPAENIAEVARSRGCEVVQSFFSESLAREIVNTHGNADMICANNVFAHIDDMHDVIRGVSALLDTDGVFVFEVHYLPDLIGRFQYDMIYHEHLLYHSLRPLHHLMALFDMEIFDVKRVAIHGGSIRVYSKKINNKKRVISASVPELTSMESSLTMKSLRQFSEAVITHGSMLHEVVDKKKRRGVRLAAYGASGRSVILTNFARIGLEYIEYIVDASPERYNRLMPGTHVPIVPPTHFRHHVVDEVLLTAWTYTEEIVGKESWFLEQGGSFIIPLPNIHMRP